MSKPVTQGQRVEINVQNPWDSKEAPLWELAVVLEPLDTQFTYEIQSSKRVSYAFYAHKNQTWRAADAEI